MANVEALAATANATQRTQPFGRCKYLQALTIDSPRAWTEATASEPRHAALVNDVDVSYHDSPTTDDRDDGSDGLTAGNHGYQGTSGSQHASGAEVTGGQRLGSSPKPDQRLYAAGRPSRNRRIIATSRSGAS